MAITLASDSWSDAEVTDAVGRGDLAAAARLWVRHWPAALVAARLYVDRAEVPGLAAEALIGTVSVTAIGRGPREDVGAFVTAAVRELGALDDEPATPDRSTDLPDVFVSPRMTSSFGELPADTQRLLRTVAREHRVEEETEPALTVLQTSYLTTHLDEAPSRECRPAHVAMIAVADGSARDGFAGHTWLHLSTCAWCTEAFHEIAFSNVALDALVTPAVLNSRLAAVPVAAVVAAAEPPPEPEIVEEPEPVRGGWLAGRRRIATAGVLAAAVVAVAVVLSQGLSSGEDPTTPTAATGSQPTSAVPTPTASDLPEPTTTDDATPLAPTASVPTGSVEVAGPQVAASDVPTAAPKPTPKPDPTPTKAPPADPDPTPSQPPADPDPTPTPSATPTRSCNPLQHLLGFC